MWPNSNFYKVLAIVCATILNINAQLSGTYTIGGTGANFPDFQTAYYALDAGNTSDTVVMLIRPGVYPTVIDGNSFYTNHPVIFRSETGLNDVVITGSWIYTFRSTWSYTKPRKLITFKHITFENTGTGSTAECIHLNRFSYLIDSCIFNGSFRLNRETGTVTAIFRNSQVNNGTAQMGGSEIYNNIFYSDVSHVTGGGGINFYHNQVFGSTGIVAGNVTENFLGGGFSSGYGGPLFVIDNEIHEGHYSAINIGYGNSIKIIGNKIFGISELNYVSSSSMINNEFYDNVYLNFDGPHWIFNNTFADTAYLKYWYTIAVVKNNLFSIGTYGNDHLVVQTNNNYHFVSNPHNYLVYGPLLDTHPYQIDPQFLPGTLDATNTDLLDLGINPPNTLYDIDSLSRPFHSTLGAHEICFSSSNINTIHSTCGSEIPLRFCFLPEGGTYTWSPGIGLNDSSLMAPTATVQNNITYHVYDSISGFEDSITIIVDEYIPGAKPDTLIGCGDMLLLSATYHNQAVYNWYPNENLSDTSAYLLTAQPLQSTDYYLTVEIPGCGAYYDTVHINVDPIPQADYQLTAITLTEVTFDDISTCADSLFWNLGDGNTSSLDSFTHTYDTAGMYMVCLTAFNSYGSDSICYYVIVYDDASVELFDDTDKKIIVYPNPSNGVIHLLSKKDLNGNNLIQVSDGTGRIVLTTSIEDINANQNIDLNLYDLRNGMYFLSITNQNLREVVPVIISR